MVVKSVVPDVNNIELNRLMRRIFEQYDLCKRIPGNPERDSYVLAVESAVGRLASREKELISKRYMNDFYCSDKVVFETLLDRPISKDTYTIIRNRAFATMFFCFCEQGLLLPEEEKACLAIP
ncbi:hypothetical protein [Paenibacillus sp. OAE614]|uniref:hypothetical protein n=1 Tax=Paenibacillus sp. OAE614 TaxID=2663804 RepID=UPI001789F405